MQLSKKFFLCVAVSFIPILLCALFYHTGSIAYTKYVQILRPQEEGKDRLFDGRKGSPDTENNSTHVKQTNYSIIFPKVNITSPPRRPLTTEVPQETCVKGYAQTEMKKLFPNYDPKVHPFLTPDFKNWSGYGQLTESSFPYGIKNEVGRIENIMNLLTSSGKPDRFGDLGSDCRRCVLIGNGGVSLGKRLGDVIDSYDVVIRMNSGPVERYEKDIGHKTTFRMIYPESAMSKYDPNSDLVYLAYKREDAMWLEAVLQKQDVRKLKAKFWKSVPQSLHTDASKVRFLNPILHTKTGEHMNSKKRPSCGVVALELAFQYCDQVDITGFGFDKDLPIHYYQSQKGFQSNGVHAWSQEKNYILRLLYCGVIGRDLSGLYAKEATLRGDSFNCTAS